MAKEREKALAKILYVDNNCNKKETAQKVGVTEKTIADWVDKFGWEAEREARNASPLKRLNNIKEIISKLSEEWLEVDRQIKRLEKEKADPEDVAKLRSRMSSIDDAVSKWNKTLEGIEKESRIPLATYLRVMEEVFTDMRTFDQDLFKQTIDFQTHHIEKVSIKLG